MTDLTNLPTIWPRWKHMPDEGTIVHILQMAHMSPDDAFAPLPGGFFAEVIERASRPHDDTTIRILTVPTSLTTMTPYGDWAWDTTFPCNLREGPSGNGMRLEIVPDHIQDAVRAYVELQGADTTPLVVEDGWLC